MKNESVNPVTHEQPDQIDLMRRAVLRGGAKLAYIAPLVFATVKATEGAYPSAGAGTTGTTGTTGTSGSGAATPCPPPPPPGSIGKYTPGC